MIFLPPGPCPIGDKLNDNQMARRGQSLVASALVGKAWPDERGRGNFKWGKLQARHEDGSVKRLFVFPTIPALFFVRSRSNNGRHDHA